MNLCEKPVFFQWFVISALLGPSVGKTGIPALGLQVPGEDHCQVLRFMGRTTAPWWKAGVGLAGRDISDLLFLLETREAGGLGSLPDSGPLCSL